MMDIITLNCLPYFRYNGFLHGFLAEVFLPSRIVSVTVGRVCSSVFIGKAKVLLRKRQKFKLMKNSKVSFTRQRIQKFGRYLLALNFDGDNRILLALFMPWSVDHYCSGIQRDQLRDLRGLTELNTGKQKGYAERSISVC